MLGDESTRTVPRQITAVGSGVQTTALMFLLFEEFFIELF
jgi:hypothetical protein